MFSPNCMFEYLRVCKHLCSLKKDLDSFTLGTVPKYRTVAFSLLGYIRTHAVVVVDIVVIDITRIVHVVRIVSRRVRRTQPPIIGGASRYNLSPTVLQIYIFTLCNNKNCKVTAKTKIGSKFMRSPTHKILPIFFAGFLPKNLKNVFLPKSPRGALRTLVRTRAVLPHFGSYYFYSIFSIPLSILILGLRASTPLDNLPILPSYTQLCGIMWNFGYPRLE